VIEVLEDANLKALQRKHKLSDAELETMKNILGRNPSYAELGVFSALWSEHCSYKSSKIHLRSFPTDGENVVVPPGENAGVVRLKDKLCVAFKMESHNHPSYIEPYQGAATGVGGIMRDVFCMGARPVANLNCLRFGTKDHPRTPYLLKEVVKGIGDYGNCIGVPTVGGNVQFHPSYNGNCLVNAMCVGLIDEDKIWKGSASGVGNLVIYLGSATGRDGIHGATMASDAFSSEQSSERATVQVGDPFLEKLLMEATLEVLTKNLVVGLQDMGAAGLTSSAFEMAERAGLGLKIDLNKVPIRTKTPMTAYELLLSESQERMLMVVEPKNLEELIKVFDYYELSHAVIGEVTQDPKVKCYYDGLLEVDVPVTDLAKHTPRYDRPYEIRVAKDFKPFTIQNERQILNESTSTDYADIYERYDRHIGLRTMRDSEHGGAAVLEIYEHDPMGLAIATACLERYCSVDALKGAAYSVLKCFRSLSCVGAKPLAITDCLNFGNPENPLVMGDFVQSVKGISLACNELGISVISGNVSLYNETDGESVFPTPMIGMVGRVDNTQNTPVAVLKDKTMGVYLLSQSLGSLSGSLAEELCTGEITSSAIPNIDWQLEWQLHNWILENKENLVLCRDVGVGGLASCVAKSLAGFKAVDNSFIASKEDLFKEGGAAYIVISHKEISHPLLHRIGTSTLDGTYDFGFFKWSSEDR
jgi:phosphoribosylformylglycinamidine synthase subunit PurL